MEASNQYEVMDNSVDSTPDVKATQTVKPKELLSGEL